LGAPLFSRSPELFQKLGFLFVAQLGTHMVKRRFTERPAFIGRACAISLSFSLSLSPNISISPARTHFPSPFLACVLEGVPRARCAGRPRHRGLLRHLGERARKGAAGGAWWNREHAKKERMRGLQAPGAVIVNGLAQKMARRVAQILSSLRSCVCVRWKRRTSTRRISWRARRTFCG
jgi:hypothetical protein